MIETYEQLQEQVASFLNRDDLTAAVPTFIRLAEADFDRRLRHWKMQERCGASIDERFEQLPDGWVETLRLQHDEGTPLDLVAHENIGEMRARYPTPGKPIAYAHSAGQIEFFPEPDTTYDIEIVYFRKVPNLTTLAPQNWLLLDAPDLYLYGSLVHSAPYLVEDARLPVWQSFYEGALRSMNEASDRGQHSGASLRVRLTGAVMRRR